MHVYSELKKTWIPACPNFKLEQAALTFYLTGAMQGCQPPTSSNIENWYGVGDGWRNNAGTWRHFLEKKHTKKMLF